MSIMKTYENHLLWRYVKVITCYLIDPLNLLMKVGGCYAVYLLQWLYVCWLLMVLQDDRILFEGKSYGLWVLPDVTTIQRHEYYNMLNELNIFGMVNFGCWDSYRHSIMAIQLKDSMYKDSVPIWPSRPYKSSHGRHWYAKTVVFLTSGRNRISWNHGPN